MYDYFRPWHLVSVWLRLHGRLHSLCRRRSGYSAHLSAGIIDSQSAKTTSRNGVHGYDGGKKVNSCRGHLFVDRSGLVLCAKMYSADVTDRDGACPLPKAAAARFAKLKHLWADASYRGQLVAWIREHPGWSVEAVLPPRHWGRYPEGVEPPHTPALRRAKDAGWSSPASLGWATKPNSRALVSSLPMLTPSTGRHRWPHYKSPVFGK